MSEGLATSAQRPLYSQLIVACWLASAALAVRAGCAGLAAARVAPATNTVAGITTSLMTFITTLRDEPGHWLGCVPALRCAELPRRSVTPGWPPEQAQASPCAMALNWTNTGVDLREDVVHPRRRPSGRIRASARRRGRPCPSQRPGK